jgi:hypothetical protein
MMRLDGKRILLVAPPFFGYYQEIITEIQSRGGVVDWLPDRPLDHPLGKAATRLAPKLAALYADRVYSVLLSGFGATTYNYILVLNGQTLSMRFLKALRRCFPSASFILYMWDSVANRRHVARNFALYDCVFSFDPSDVAFYRLRLRPLFFTRQFSPPHSPTSFSYDLSFIGTVHSDRYAVFDRTRSCLPPSLNTYWYLYLQAPWVYYLYRFTKSAMRHSRLDEFHFVPLDMPSVNRIFQASRAVLDICHPRQSGLTMRTLEALGSCKKLVTTNAAVRNYDFYDDCNITVIDRQSPRISPDFLFSGYSSVRPDILHRYSIAGWLDEVLGS